MQALERDNHEKAQIITAAEQHAKDMDKELGNTIVLISVITVLRDDD